MDAWCVYAFFCVFAVLCLGRGFMTSWQIVRGILPIVNRSRDWKAARGHEGCRAIQKKLTSLCLLASGHEHMWDSEVQLHAILRLELGGYGSLTCRAGLLIPWEKTSCIHWMGSCSRFAIQIMSWFLLDSNHWKILRTLTTKPSPVHHIQAF
jgi:hypothetical protein